MFLCRGGKPQEQAGVVMIVTDLLRVLTSNGGFSAKIRTNNPPQSNRSVCSRTKGEFAGEALSSGGAGERSGREELRVQWECEGPSNGLTGSQSEPRAAIPQAPFKNLKYSRWTERNAGRETRELFSARHFLVRAKRGENAKVFTSTTGPRERRGEARELPKG